jgi:hypothetical protein
MIESNYFNNYFMILFMYVMVPAHSLQKESTMSNSERRPVIQLACEQQLIDQAKAVAAHKGVGMSEWIRNQIMSSYKRLPDAAKITGS